MDAFLGRRPRLLHFLQRCFVTVKAGFKA